MSDFGPWFKFYTDAINDPKVQCLDPYLFKAWVNVLCLARNDDGRINQAELPFRLRMSSNDAESVVTELMRAGLIDYAIIKGDRCLTPHNWGQRQPKLDKSAVRMQKLRAKRGAENSCDASRDGNGDGRCDGDVLLSHLVSSVPPSHIGMACQEGNSTYVGSTGVDCDDEVPL